MFRVIAVDDEPAALEFLSQIVTRRCPGFAVVGTASNGEECLKLLETCPADVVLTDVRMPVMNGLELAERLNREYPDVRTLIVSSYQEFEYVRSALHSGVYDYLTKPLMPAAFVEVFDRLREVLEERLLERRNRMLQELSRGKRPNPAELKLCFPDEAYHCALVRGNGLPKRFSRVDVPELYEDGGDRLSIFGRDEMERIYLRPAQGVELEAFVREAVGESESTSVYLTTAATQNPFGIERLPDVLRRLYRLLDECTVLGQSQVIYLEGPGRQHVAQEEPDTNALRLLEHYLMAGNREEARSELKRLMWEWDRKRFPQLWLERQLRYILFLTSRSSGGDRFMQVGEHLLDDAFYSITSMDEMIAYMDDLLFGNILEDREDNGQPELLAQYERVRDYVRQHFAEQLSLKRLSEEFNISESYLNKMFRRFENTSFKAFLTEIRIERACAMLRAMPDTYIKEVAAAVGYTDPFYFSKSFRSYTGKSPKEFAQSLKISD